MEIYSLSEMWSLGILQARNPTILGDLFFSSVEQKPKSGPDRLTVEVSRSDTDRNTAGRTPLYEWSAHWSGCTTTQHTTNTREHPCPQRVSKPRSQQWNCFRLTP
jgi:hypothetical protein